VTSNLCRQGWCGWTVFHIPQCSLELCQQSASPSGMNLLHHSTSTFLEISVCILGLTKTQAKQTSYTIVSTLSLHTLGDLICNCCNIQYLKYCFTQGLLRFWEQPCSNWMIQLLQGCSQNLRSIWISRGLVELTFIDQRFLPCSSAYSNTFKIVCRGAWGCV